MYYHRPLCLSGPPLLLRNRFQTRRPTAPALPPQAACCPFHGPAPGDRSVKRVPFLKAVSTGASALLSQAAAMPRHRAFRSMRVYYTVLRRPAQATGESLRPDSDFPRKLCFPRGDARVKRLLLYARFSHSAANTRLRQATKAAHRTDSDFPATSMLSQRFSAWHEPHFAAASSERLWVFILLRQGRRAAGELVPLGTCFPGLQVHSQSSPCFGELSRHSHNPAAACVS